MKSKRLALKAAAVMTAGALGGGLTFAGVAHAAVYTKDVHGVIGQLDTAAGNGSKAWMWGYAPAHVSRGVVQYQFYNGQIGSFDVAPRTARSVNLNTSVWRIQACAVYWVQSDDPKGGGPSPSKAAGWYEEWHCSGWS
ncbi:hypothetical protein [Actinoplanes sichuanensis]|uniref:Lactococcin 972 family bacteriocin n=1 Tax=Actinoplanes sichuanensis TaxID=512349 RepID=A0ABW4A457_9ACTN|nr:hypothetical protein [Actinoplanes sichuanensis]